MKTYGWILCVAMAAAVAACGSRTGLLAPASRDGAPAADAGDALPPIADVPDAPDTPGPCPDAGATLVYTITVQSVLMSFYPITGTFTTIGTIACPTDPADTPFSMAVDHTGVAYVAFNSGAVFRVSTLDASCQATARVPPPGVFQSQFGMGFAANPGADAGDAGDGIETLYLAGNPSGTAGGAPIVLGAMNTTTFDSRAIAAVTPSIYGSELTGTGGGQLFGFFETSPSGATAAIGQIDRTTGQLTAMTDLPGVNIAGGWAFAFWGGEFYTFTAPAGSTVVTRFNPNDGSVVQVAQSSDEIVGAGVSTCAPQQ